MTGDTTFETAGSDDLLFDGKDSPTSLPGSLLARPLKPKENIGSHLTASNSGVAWQEFRRDQGQESSFDEKVFDALSAAKVTTSRVAMHLSAEWRHNLFQQLDSLHDLDEFSEGEEPAKTSSFKTFLRTLLFIKPSVMPGLGMSIKGNLLAFWTVGKDRLTMEFRANDQIIWTLSVSDQGGDAPERAAGDTKAERIKSVLEPYDSRRWFEHVE